MIQRNAQAEGFSPSVVLSPGGQPGFTWPRNEAVDPCYDIVATATVAGAAGIGAVGVTLTFLEQGWHYVRAQAFQTDSAGGTFTTVYRFINPDGSVPGFLQVCPIVAPMPYECTIRVRPGQTVQLANLQAQIATVTTYLTIYAKRISR